MMRIFISIYKFIINCLYAAFKTVRPQAKKVVFISRLSNDISQDFMMLQNELSDVTIVTIFMRDNGDALSKIKLVYYSFTSIIALSNCSVCVLDSYWPTVSLLNTKSFTVIQLWHSIGKIKQSGHQTNGKQSGRRLDIANLMHMHGNYDYVIAGGEFWNPFYCASFGIRQDIIKNYGLPRIDRLLNKKDELRTLFFNAYPDRYGKPIILYAPTFRKGYTFDFLALPQALKQKGFNVIVKLHPNTCVKVADAYQTCSDVPLEACLCAADYLITDYSAVSLEAMVVDTKTYFYTADYNQYTALNGLNLDVKTYFPTLCFDDAKTLAEYIAESEYPTNAFLKYKEHFLPTNLGTSTKKIVQLIKESIQ